jgi:spore germination protein (amino acid permease)
MDSFSSKHYAAIIFTTSIVSLKTYPTIFLINGKRDSWIALIIASAFLMFYFLKIISIWKKNNTYNLYQVYTTALGNTLGKALIILFIFTLIVTLIECASVEANSMHSNMVLETPVWYLLLFFIIPCIYVVRQDIVAIVIITSVIILLIFLSGINLAMLTSKYKKFDYLFPIFENGITMNFFVCILKILGLYGCIIITLPYLSRIQDRTKMLKHSLIAILVVIQMHIVSVSGLVMTFTPERLVILNYPKLIQTQLVSYQRFFEYGELYVLFQMLGGWLMKYIITFYALLLLLKELNINRKGLILLTYLISFITFIAAYFAGTNIFVLYKLLNYYSYICLVNFVIIPSLVFFRYSEVMKQNTKKVSSS